METRTKKLIVAAVSVAVATTVFGFQTNDRDSRGHEDRENRQSRGGYRHDQQGKRRDLNDHDSRDSRRYEGSHNRWRDNDSRVDIHVVDPDRMGREGSHDEMRSGYYRYDSDWRDDRFRFPGYAFEYDSTGTAFSPFYYYPMVPGYVVMSDVDPSVGATHFHFYKTIDWDSRDRDMLDPESTAVVNRLVDGVAHGDVSDLAAFVPSGYSVDVYPGIGKPYSMDSDRFYDMLADMAASTTTQDYDVTKVETGDNCLRVSLRHRFQDPWKRPVESYHRITLDRVDGDYRIARFESKRRHF